MPKVTYWITNIPRVGNTHPDLRPMSSPLCHGLHCGCLGAKIGYHFFPPFWLWIYEQASYLNELASLESVYLCNWFSFPNHSALSASPRRILFSITFPRNSLIFNPTRLWVPLEQEPLVFLYLLYLVQELPNSKQSKCLLNEWMNEWPYEKSTQCWRYSSAAKWLPAWQAQG